jgi:ankyrin repeat protein
MRNWDDYKDTFKLSEDVFDLARSGETHRLQEFLDSSAEADINQKNHKGYSPLMISVYNGNYETSKLLLQSGANPNSYDLSGNTVLMGAAFKGDAELIALLIERGAEKDLKNRNGLTAEEWASAFGRKNVLSILRPEASYSVFQSIINFTKIIWGMTKSHYRKEITA